MKRYIEPAIIKDLTSKIVILTGPRQSGKTTISKQLNLSYDYLNMDNQVHMHHVINRLWDRSKELLILDEFHKFKNWKRFIKGVYDTEGLSPKILITGSAKLNTFKNVGDSLAGRYFQHRLYPIDLHEACTNLKLQPKEAFDILINCSGFPEPFLKADNVYYKRWYKTHNQIMLQQDLIDVTEIKEIKSVMLLAELLKTRIGSNINYSKLALDLQVSPVSVKNWCYILENMYMFFIITPYHNNIARSLLKEPKIYCYDIASVRDIGMKLENLVALALLKRIHFLEDTQGSEVALHYCRTKDGKEIDFLVKINEIIYLIEVKSSDDQISKNFAYFNKYFQNNTCKCFQLVKNLTKEYSNQAGYQVLDLVNWLSKIDQYLI